ncbi:glycosyltransferase family 1 protein [Salinicola endophyticus]|uniref:Glycosyltransferase family 1 protein n=1 Tax=Salinicola endophyticus TaxID=1949083 RepID=A0ABY8FE60_9GAMM|nr:glycosyltransferase family 4 protein [Salinicola endophyticus]WFF41114.1 glycosyltransferase family 1 protein [Salinicola endophyticus]
MAGRYLSPFEHAKAEERWGAYPLVQICHINLARGYRGGERQTELLIRELARREVVQRAVVRAGEPLADRLADVERLTLIKLDKPFTAGLRHVKGDILHAHESRAAQLAWCRGWLSKTPYVVTRRIGKRPGNSWLTRSVYRRAAACVGVAGSVARTVADYAHRDTDTIYSALSDLPVDPQRRDQLRQRWGDAFVVVNVAALVNSQKGQSHLIEVARQASIREPRLHFVLVGSGKDRAILEKQASGLPNLEFAGFVDNVGDYLAAADAFALPSLHEGIGGAALDAMNAGLPVIASAVDGLPEFVEDGVNGILVEPGDEQGLLAATLRMFEDSTARQRMARAGRETALGFSVGHMADAYQALYRRIMPT